MAKLGKFTNLIVRMSDRIVFGNAFLLSL